MRTFSGGGAVFKWTHQEDGSAVAAICDSETRTVPGLTLSDLIRGVADGLLKEVSVASTKISYFDQPGPGKGFLYSGRILWDGKETFRIVSGTDVERSDYRPEDLIRDHKAGRISRSTVSVADYQLLVNGD